MFYGCSSLVTLDLSKATFRKTTNTRYMFYGCSSLVTLDLRLATFESSTDASYMFQNCTNLTTLYLNSASFSNINTYRLYGMFENCGSLTTLVLPHTSSFIYDDLDFSDCVLLSETSIEHISYWIGTYNDYSYKVKISQQAWNNVQNKTTIRNRIEGKGWQLQLV